MWAGLAKPRRFTPAWRGRAAALAVVPVLAGCGPVFGPRLFDLLLMLGLVATATVIGLALYDRLWSRRRWPGSRSSPRRMPQSPTNLRELLDWRYASGEIDRKTWQQAINDLDWRQDTPRSKQT